MIFTDTHTHLYAEEFNEDRMQVVQNSLLNNVTRLFLPNIDSSSIEGMLELSKYFPDNCFPMIGLHPCSVNESYIKELETVKYWLDERKFYAIGEIGIDLYWDKSFAKEQEEAFSFQIELAKEYSLPIVIHTRNSFDETFSIVQKLNSNKLKGIFHCFSGTIDQAKQVLNLGGFKLGIGGVVTFKNSGLGEVVKSLSLEDIVLETDSPYLSPVPYRGKRNESSYIVNIASKIAEIMGVQIEKVAEVTTANSKDIFGI